MNHYTSPTSINFPAVGIALPAAVSPTLGEQTSTTELQSPCKGSKLFWFQSCPKMVTIKTRSRDHDTDYEPPFLHNWHIKVWLADQAVKDIVHYGEVYTSLSPLLFCLKKPIEFDKVCLRPRKCWVTSLSYRPSDFSKERPCSDSDILSGRLGYHTFSCGFSGECNACHNTFRDVML